MKVTVSGAPGSGKSSIAKTLAEKLHYPYFSAGSIMRGMAQEEGVQVLDISKRAEKDGGIIDRKIDDRTKQLGEKHKDVVIEGHFAYAFVPDSVKIYLDVDPKEAVKRILAHRSVAEEQYTSEEEAVENIKRRMESNTIRCKRNHGFNFPPRPEDVDVLIDTTDMTFDQVFAAIVKILKEYGLEV